MSFVRSNTLVVCLLSNDSRSRSYEEDLIRELRAKNLGHMVGVCRIGNGEAEASKLFDEVIPALLSNVPDDVRAPFEILGPQLLGYHLSLLVGLNPDSPSPGGVIIRVAQGIRIHG